MIREFCAENHTHVAEAISAGVNRIELCDNLAVGGTTPSPGVIRYICQLAGQSQVPVMTMIRPRGGHFVYTADEIQMMLEDIAMARECGTTGLVFGALTAENHLDKQTMEILLEACEGLEVTFHMAFDTIPPAEQFEVIDWLSEQGVRRILTHGGVEGTSIEDNIACLQNLVQYASGKLTILIGGGVTWENAQDIVDKTGTTEVHGTRIYPS
ncbi:copper homeostasis protein CutC [Streptococcus sp. 20-1249]|uniref:copper homeostasis protein CutC n=1 Tax=Streptococcus hepaticus TaxID=3349163 RepID=UPI0037482C80